MAFHAHPNPASNVLTIDLIQQIDLTQQKATDVSKSRTVSNAAYDIRLYDGMGNIVRRQQQVKSGKVQFDVSRLPEGTYYLHVYDGIRKEPHMHQIVVERK